MFVVVYGCDLFVAPQGGSYSSTRSALFFAICCFLSIPVCLFLLYFCCYSFFLTVIYCLQVLSLGGTVFRGLPLATPLPLATGSPGVSSSTQWKTSISE